MQIGKSTGPRVESANQAKQTRRIPGKVEISHLFPQHFGIRGCRLALFFGDDAARLEAPDGVENCLRAELLKLRKQAPAGFLRTEGQRIPAENVAGIQSLVHLHGRDTALLLSVDNGPLNRRRSPVSGKQRRVNVHAAVARQFENFFRQNLTERGHDKELRLLLTEQPDKVRISRSLRLRDRYSEAKRGFLDRRKL